MVDDKDRRHDARRSGYEMRSEPNRRRKEENWAYLEKRSGDDRRKGEDRRDHERRHDEEDGAAD